MSVEAPAVDETAPAVSGQRRSPLPVVAAAVVLLAAMVAAAFAVPAPARVTPESSPEPTTTGRSGDVCGWPGLVAVDADGRRLACTTTTADGQLRWRAWQLDLPVR